MFVLDIPSESPRRLVNFKVVRRHPKPIPKQSMTLHMILILLEGIPNCLGCHKYWKFYVVLLHLPLFSILSSGLVWFSCLREMPYAVLIVCAEVLTVIVVIAFVLSLSNNCLSSYRIPLAIFTYVFMLLHCVCCIWLLAIIYDANWDIDRGGPRKEIYIPFIFFGVIIAAPMLSLALTCVLILAGIIELFVLCLRPRAKPARINFSLCTGVLFKYAALGLENLTCPVCMAEFLPDDDIVELRCGYTHVMHSDCAQKQVWSRGTCSVCDERASMRIV